MATFFSNLYPTASDGRSRIAWNPTDRRCGEAVWVKASAVLPAGTVAGDIIKIAQVVEGIRPVSGYTTASAVNGSMTVSLGYTGAATAILNASTQFQAVTPLALTATQITAVTVLSPVGGGELIATIGGTFTNPTTLTFWLQFVNFQNGA